MLKKSLISNAGDAVLKNLDFSESSLKITILSKF